MNHVRHIHVFKALMDGAEPDTIDFTSGITAVNMVKNFVTIRSMLDTRLKDLIAKRDNSVYPIQPTDPTDWVKHRLVVRK